MNNALWTLPCLVVACAGSQARPADATTNIEMRCSDALDHPTAYSSGERADCARREARKADERRQSIHCDDVYAQPEAYTDTERIRCDYVRSPEQPK